MLSPTFGHCPNSNWTTTPPRTLLGASPTVLCIKLVMVLVFPSQLSIGIAPQPELNIDGFGYKTSAILAPSELPLGITTQPFQNAQSTQANWDGVDFNPLSCGFCAQPPGCQPPGCHAWYSDAGPCLWQTWRTWKQNWYWRSGIGIEGIQTSQTWNQTFSLRSLLWIRVRVFQYLKEFMCLLMAIKGSYANEIYW